LLFSQRRVYSKNDRNLVGSNGTHFSFPTLSLAAQVLILKVSAWMIGSVAAGCLMLTNSIWGQNPLYLLFITAYKPWTTPRLILENTPLAERWSWNDIIDWLLSRYPEVLQPLDDIIHHIPATFR
jgi:hypothetical protein